MKKIILGLLLFFPGSSFAGDLALNADLSNQDTKVTHTCHVGDRIGIRWYPGALIIGKLDKARVQVLDPWIAEAGNDDNGKRTVWYMYRAKKVGTVCIQMEWCDPNKCTVNGYTFDINP